MKKIMLFTSYGTRIPFAIADEMKRLGKEYPESRHGEIIDFIEKIAEPIMQRELSDIEISKQPNKLFKVIDHKSSGFSWEPEYDLYYGCDEHNTAAAVKVYHIDETEQHIITDYDGAEGIKAVPKYKCIDSTLNLWAEIQPWEN